MGSMLGIKAFVAAVLGGIGILPGAVIGGFILGIVESLTRAYLSSQLADAFVFSIFNYSFYYLNLLEYLEKM